MRNSLKQTKDTKLSILSLQKTTLHLSQYFINQLNRAMNNRPSETVSSKYCEPCELSFLMNNSKNCLSFSNLNIQGRSETPSNQAFEGLELLQL